MKKYFILPIIAMLIAFSANAMTPETSHNKVNKQIAETITVKKEFYGSNFTGDWTRPCSGKTLEKMATIKVEFLPVKKGYSVIAIMYDKAGIPIKAGHKFCQSTPLPDFQHFKLDNMMELEASDFPPLQ